MQYKLLHRGKVLTLCKVNGMYLFSRFTLTGNNLVVKVQEIQSWCNGKGTTDAIRVIEETLIFTLQDGLLTTDVTDELVTKLQGFTSAAYAANKIK